jgi:chemotaxis protein methyltransferase CheR
VSLLVRLGDRIGNALGARDPESASLADVEARVAVRLRATGLESLGPYLARLDDALSTELPHLAGAFTNGWTWFLRDQDAIDELAARMSPREGPVRVWVAGCATGEEAYSVIIAFLERGLDVEVVGSDVDAQRLQHAAEGVYGSSALRRVPEPLVQRYFERLSDGRFLVRPELRRRLELKVHNLLEPPLLPPLTPLCRAGWDAIVCRNVLIHLTADGARRVHENLLSARARHLVLGPADGIVTIVRPSTRPPVPPTRTAEVFRPRPSSPPPRPTPPDDWQALGRAIRAGAHVDAAARAEALTRSEAHVGPAWLVVGNLALHAHDLDRARAAYAAADRHLATSAELHFLWGTLHRRAGAWLEASRSLRRALLIDPDLWPAWFALAGAIERHAAPAEAEAARRETARAIERRERISWMSFVDDIEGLACPRELVRAACTRHDVTETNEDPRWRTR